MALKNDYPDLFNIANDVLFVFRLMYLCDVSFLAMTAIQAKYQYIHFRTRPSFKLLNQDLKKIFKPFLSHCSFI